MALTRLIRLLPLLALWVTAPAFGADGSAIMYPRAAAGGSAVLPGERPGTVAPLVVAFVLAAGGGWVLWRSRRRIVVKRGSALAIHETRSLGGRQYLVVASYENQKFLLGVCPGTINLLSNLGPAPEKADAS